MKVANTFGPKVDDEYFARLNEILRRLYLKRSPASIKREAAAAILTLHEALADCRVHLDFVKDQNLALGKANRDMNR